MRLAASRGVDDERGERIALERGHHMCRKVTAALQKEMLTSLTSGGEHDFACACAPVIVYSLENHFLDANTRRQLAFKCVKDRTFASSVICSSLHHNAYTFRNTLHQIRGGR